MPVQFQVYALPDSNTSEGDDVDTSMRLDVLWEVQVPGQQPYQVREERKAPLWTAESGLLGQGDRWYKKRLKRTHGLLPYIGVPCVVNPQQPTQLWIDWDAGYQEHLAGWEHHEERQRQETEAFSQAQAQQWQAWGQQQMAAMGYGTGPATPQGQLDAQTAESARLLAAGTPTPATVVACTPTGGQLVGRAVYEVHVDVHDTDPPRRVVAQLALEPPQASLCAAGGITQVRIDPLDPSKFALG
jgi:hypothetical protein